MRETAIETACAHLGAAISQSIPKDDQIIMDHVKAAYEILKIVRGSGSVARDAVTAIRIVKQVGPFKRDFSVPSSGLELAVAFEVAANAGIEEPFQIVIPLRLLDNGEVGVEAIKPPGGLSEGYKRR